MTGTGFSEEASSFGRLSKSDKIAEEAALALKADAMFISLLDEQYIYSFGAHMKGAGAEKPRFHHLRDVLCKTVIMEGCVLSVSDARDDENFKDVAYVKHGAIVGYLGLPIHDQNLEIIGGICATTMDPREWSDQDKNYLASIADVVEANIKADLYKAEAENLSDALEDYDRILLSILDNKEQLVSIHESSGAVIFASNELIQIFGRDMFELTSKEVIMPDAAPGAAASIAQDGDSQSSLTWAGQRFEIAITEGVDDLLVLKWVKQQPDDA